MKSSLREDFIIAAHLDLKGMQFRPEYIPQLLRDFAAQGVNTLLVEYEDVFPFSNMNFATDVEMAWSQDTLQKFLDEAHSLGLAVIPLQQCLGHLEYMLCWKELRAFALDADYPSTLNIFNPDARSLIQDLLRQMMEAHPESRYFHLGLDEAFSLVTHVKERGESVCRWFVEYAESLCDICEEYGKKPLIWSDILEHHLTPDDLPIIERLRDRVVICTWDYTTQQSLTPIVRWGGNFVSRDWLESPHSALAPTVTGTTEFIDEMPAVLRESIDAYGHGSTFTSIFQADLWTKMGFTTLGTTACRISYDGPILPYYNWRWANIELWANVARRSGQAGIIISAWARGTSWCWPNYSFDLCWPLIHAMTSALGAAPRPFFAGIEPETVERIFRTLGRCRDDWKREEAVAMEMEELAPNLLSHVFEWQSAILMARLLGLHRRVAFAVAEVEDFWANCRPVDSEWQRRLNDQAKIAGELAVMREQIIEHFSKRYWGKAFDEWISTLFDIHEERLKRLGQSCREKLQAARYEHNTRVITRNAPVLAAV